MAKAVKQFRFYGEDTDALKNYPTEVNIASLKNGSVFKPYLPILQLGVQALPGTKFYLNDAVEPIIIGHTGIYELDLDIETQISGLQFNSKSLEIISNNENAYLIVDIIYDSIEEV